MSWPYMGYLVKIHARQNFDAPNSSSTYLGDKKF